jgi:pimeloyl-ACP methyl ester carboxylesterase
VSQFQTREVTLSSGQLRIAEAGQGRPLLHLHTAAGPRVSGVVTALTARRRVIAPTTPGFDGTARHEAVDDFPAVADLYAEFLNKEIGAPCDVIGESFGGRIALWLAARHPGLVDHLVLEGPAGFRRPSPDWPTTDPDKRMRMLYARPDRAPKEDRSAEQQAANTAAAASYSHGVLFDETLAAKLPDITARSLIVMGEQERVIPLEAAHLLKARIPHSHLTYVFGAAHAIEFDQPELVGRLVADFLERGESFIVREPDAA